MRFGEQAQIDLEVQGLDQPSLRLGLSGIIGDLDERLARLVAQDLLDPRIRSARGEDLQGGNDAEQVLHEQVQSLLVRNADQGVPDGNPIIHLFDNVHTHEGLLLFFFS